jgi:hypothetical protein
VPRNTVRCPSCGRYFTAIQCPQCSFQGSEEDFASGCPRCGYMRPREVGRGGAAGPRPGPGARRRDRKRAARERSGGGGGDGVPAESGPSGPPLAVYKLMGLVLLVLLGVLIAVLLLL